jgi:BirA family transcriptional regulator, biotin operon repressor / biotin---[acetyl-CoA-carboxylase] ligase
MPLDIAFLRSRRPELNLHYFPTIGSTMTEASRLARVGAPDRTVVLAEEQTAGVGRMGRTWTSEPEVGIYCSVLLRLPLPQEHLPVVSLLLGLATAEAIRTTAGIPCDLRWPNDVLFEERKMAGVLAHLSESCVIAGIGINVNNTAFHPDLRTPGTSLRLAAGRPINREALFLNLIDSIDRLSSLLIEKGPATVLDAFTAGSSYVRNRHISIEEDGSTGVTAGLDESGFLLVRMKNGTLRKVVSGGIRPVVNDE